MIHTKAWIMSCTPGVISLMWDLPLLWSWELDQRVFVLRTALNFVVTETHHSVNERRSIWGNFALWMWFHLVHPPTATCREERRATLRKGARPTVSFIQQRMLWPQCGLVTRASVSAAHVSTGYTGSDRSSCQSIRTRDPLPPGLRAHYTNINL
jgi:hypothetical protein